MSDVQLRIEELETRVAHQDKIIAELNEVITAQWKKFEALERQINHLRGEVESFDQRDTPNERPPHY
jgi:SlyX protein